MDLLRRVTDELKKEGFFVIIGGGWAEELQELKKPWAHKDIDLYMIEADFSALDEIIAAKKYKIVKNMPHKRAYLVDGVMVEVVLIKKSQTGYASNYWGEKIINWPKNLYKTNGELIVFTPETLNFYRSIHSQLFTGRE